jgi:hypothetical protein
MFLGALLFGRHEEAPVDAADNHADEYRYYRALPTKQEAGGCHEFDISPTKGTGDDKRYHKQGYTDAEQSDDPADDADLRCYKYRQDPTDEKGDIKAIGDLHGVSVYERDNKQDAEHEEIEDGRNSGSRVAYEGGVCLQERRSIGKSSPGSKTQQTADQLDNHVPGRDGSVTIAALPSKEQIAENRNKVERLKAMVAIRAKRISSDKIEFERNAIDKHIKEASYDCAEHKGKHIKQYLDFGWHDSPNLCICKMVPSEPLDYK